MNTKIFPTILIILDICASAVYASKGNWRMMIYWEAAETDKYVDMMTDTPEM